MDDPCLPKEYFVTGNHIFGKCLYFLKIYNYCSKCFVTIRIKTRIKALIGEWEGKKCPSKFLLNLRI